MYMFSDVRNVEHYIAPVVIAAQHGLAVGLYKGRLWGLIGYSLFLVALFVVIFVYYADNLTAARNTSIALSPMLLPVINLWIRKRDYFQ